MRSDETSWLDLVKEHKWSIVVVVICIFAGISYFSLGNNPSGESAASPTATPGYTYQAPTATPSPTATGQSTGRPTLSPTPTIAPVPVGTSSQAPTPSDWRPTANAFAKAWANPKVGQQAWLDALKPTVTPDLYEEFTSTDVGRMSQLEVADITSESEDYAGVNARVSFKGTTFSMKIHLSPQADMSWRVSVVTSS